MDKMEAINDQEVNTNNENLNDKSSLVTKASSEEPTESNTGSESLISLHSQSVFVSAESCNANELMVSKDLEGEDNRLIQPNNDNNSDSEDIHKKTKPKSRKVFDSDSENDRENNENVTTKNSEDGDQVSKRKHLNSDSDASSNESTDNIERKNNEIANLVEANRIVRNRISSLIDSDTESDLNDNIVEPIKTTRKKKFSKKIKSSSEKKKAENKHLENEDDSSDDILSRMNINLGTVCDEDLPSSESGSSNENELGEIMPVPEEQMNQKKHQRLSAKEAMEQMKIIQSESQRMAREANCSVPYHKPKQRTLQEFLNRKSLMKQSQMDVSHNPKKTAAAIKMTREELEEYMKKLEERAEEAKEFFKSTSEETVKVELNDNMPEVSEISTEDKIETTNMEIDNVSNIASESEPLGLEVVAMNNQVMTIVPEKNVQINDIAAEESTEIESYTQKTAEEELDEIDKLLNKKYGAYEAAVEDQAKNSHYEPNDEVCQFPLNKCPTLKGEPNMVIDLETGVISEKMKTGPDLLLDRLMKTTAKRIKQSGPTKLSVLNVENGVVNLDNITITSNEKVPINVTYLQMRETLQKQIAEKRKETILKKNEEALKLRKLEEDEYSDYDIDEEDNDVDDEEIEEENDCKNFNDEEALDDNDEKIISEDEDDKESTDNSDNDLEAELENTNVKKKSRIIAFEDSDEEKSEPQTDLRKLQPSQEINLNNLADATENILNSQSYGFLFAEDNEKTGRNALYTQETPNSLDDSQLLDLCSGQFVTQPVVTETQQSTQVHFENMDEDTMEKNITLFQSSDEDEGNLEAKRPVKKSFKKLGFSDDENDAEEDVTSQKNNELDDDLESDIEENNDEERFVEYDSEENEIEVRLTKKEQRVKAREFVDNEAELSESEWGSADEDEKNLDKLDMELGDEDEFDQNQLHSELERIHMRRVLDQDAREVKILQEMLLEDEENDGVGRERKFRWRNVDNSLSLENDNRKEDENALNNDSDDENELIWRKMRFERELVLKERENNKNGETSSHCESLIRTPDSTTSIMGDSTLTGGTSKKKFNIIKSSSRNQNNETKNSPFLITKLNTTSVSKASFLTRDEMILNKLANLAKGDTENLNFTSKNSSNFVFATLSPSVKQNENALKRKSEEGQIILQNENKKIKINEKTNSKKRLLDHLVFNT